MKLTDTQKEKLACMLFSKRWTLGVFTTALSFASLLSGKIDGTQFVIITGGAFAVIGGTEALDRLPAHYKNGGGK